MPPDHGKESKERLHGWSELREDGSGRWLCRGALKEQEDTPWNGPSPAGSHRLTSALCGRRKEELLGLL